MGGFFLLDDPLGLLAACDYTPTWIEVKHDATVVVVSLSA